MEINGSRVDAEPLPLGLGPVVEDVAQVCPALRARDLGPEHVEARVLGQLDAALLEDLVEGRPAAAAVVLVLRGEELLLADDAGVDAALVVLVVAAGVRALGALLLGHVPLQRGQPALELLLVELLGHLGRGTGLPEAAALRYDLARPLERQQGLLEAAAEQQTATRHYTQLGMRCRGVGESIG